MTRVPLLYGAVILIWGSTWVTIPYQLGVVAEEVSVAYRFALGSLLLFAYAVLSGRRISLPTKGYGFVILMGATMFSGGYMFVYFGANYIASGLIAVVFSLIVISVAVFERIFFNTPLERRMLLAAVFGLCGMGLVFWPEISSSEHSDRTITGVSLVGAGVIMASIGAMAAIKCARNELPVVGLNAHAMAWGALISIVFAGLMGRSINFSTEPAYMMSLAYLSVFGSAVAFGCFLSLMRLIGSARAAYTSVIYPIVALLISTAVEGYQWSISALVGMALIVCGNWLALTKTNN